MGLDITAYRKLRPAPEAKIDTDGNPVEWKKYSMFSKWLIDYTEKEFPGRATDLNPGIYAFSQSHGFRAGSYSGYNWWRDHLAKMVYGKSAQQLWRQSKKLRLVAPTPFLELIDFSDCEGVIGPTVAKKLAADFAEQEAAAENYARTMSEDGTWWIKAYRDWRIAFEMAADDGCVAFH